ncbi:MAG: hypothetical protein HY695_29670 [Deltaproteobacteria bacterium]|nr:hypothetical protein [Deltaproteobacteria bacterium]
MDNNEIAARLVAGYLANNKLPESKKIKEVADRLIAFHRAAVEAMRPMTAAEAEKAIISAVERRSLTDVPE